MIQLLTFEQRLYMDPMELMLPSLKTGGQKVQKVSSTSQIRKIACDNRIKNLRRIPNDMNYCGRTQNSKWRNTRV